MKRADLKELAQLFVESVAIAVAIAALVVVEICDLAIEALRRWFPR